MRKNRMTKSVLVAAALALVLTGCGAEKTKTITGDQNAPGQSTPSGGENKADGEKQEENTVLQQPEQKGFVFTYQGVTMVVDAPSETALSALGDPLSYFEAASCAFEGLDKMYTYPGFELDTYPTPEGDRISGVLLRDDTVTTPEGVGIGDTVSKLEEAYGSSFTEEGGKRIYEKDGMKLSFILKDGMVTSVEYRTTVLDE